jgi:hypothetical protein
VSAITVRAKDTDKIAPQSSEMVRLLVWAVVAPSVWELVGVSPMSSKDVGDVTSDEKGSGARFNVGKPPYELIPVGFFRSWLATSDNYTGHPDVRRVLSLLEVWQRKEIAANRILPEISKTDMADAANVLDYGRDKYAEWNWAKGMKWSVPVGCILRHCEKIVMYDEYLDDESGFRHFAHIVCNVLMLVHFDDHYPEGDDRPINIWLENNNVIDT